MAMRWTKALSVGMESIDEQHKELFRRAAGFLDGLGSKSRQDVGVLLSYLRAYAVAHFGEEEELMRSARYPGYERHKQQHDRFLRDLVSLSNEQEKRHGTGVPPGRLAAWVEEWLVQHLGKTDTEMVKFFRSQRRGAGRAAPQR